MLNGGISGYGWGNYIMYTYGILLQSWSPSYWLLRYIIDNWAPISLLIWYNNLTGSWISYVQQGAAAAGVIGLSATLVNGSNYTSKGKVSNFHASASAIGYGAFMYMQADANKKSRQDNGEEIATACDPTTGVCLL
jgi:hypothetical protein